MTFEEFFKRCWFWFYHPEGTNEYGIEVGANIGQYEYRIELYEVTEELFSDPASAKETVARQFYGNLNMEGRI